MNTVRGFEALRLRASGFTFREIGKVLGRVKDPNIPMSVERTRRLVYQAVRFVAHPSRPDHPLREAAKQVCLKSKAWHASLTLEELNESKRSS